MKRFPRSSLRALDPVERPHTRWRKYGVLASGVLVSAVAAGASCSSGAPDEELHGTAKLAATGDDPTCVTLQRGTLGTVEDGTIWETFPTWSDQSAGSRTPALFERR
ncbi:hypothetical protein [Sorangium sp. So ce1000]|uniref:hypothetical protein n=1 Tax=Sorangium sp. So ce1000 TaxID=3133325 RepID=UPI003F5F402C